MSNVISVPASERFSETALTNAIDEGNNGPIYTLYTCPRCSHALNLTREDFESRGRRKTTNLADATAHAISTSAHAQGLDRHEYLDWGCPKCNLAARVYFSLWAGGRHGDGGADLMTVFETD